MKTTSPKAIETETEHFTKDEVLCTAVLPELGSFTAATPNYHTLARFSTKDDLVQQLAWMHPEKDEPFWKMFRKETLAVVAASRLEALGMLS